jgi:membrane associated rhomboid family serine protease
MIEDSVRQRRPIPLATLVLIGLNVVVYCVVEWATWHTKWPVDLLALSRDGLNHGYWWQLITFQFLHAPLAGPFGFKSLMALDLPWHLILNCWGIFVFGPPVEFTLGKRHFATLYLASGIAGGLLQVLVSVLSHRFGGAVVGASAGLFGLIAAFTTLYPDARMTVLLFLVIPIRMTANTLLTVAALLTAIGLFVSGLWPYAWINNIAHAAHLGGLLAGLAFLRWKMKKLFGRTG